MTNHLPTLCRRLALPLLLSPLLAQAAPLYSMTIVADYVPFGAWSQINNAGNMAIESYSARDDHTTNVTVYQNGTATKLDGFGGLTKNTHVRDMNNAGQVVGDSTYANGKYHAYLAQNGSMTDLTPGAGYLYSAAQGINDAGQVIGYAELANHQNVSFLYQNGSLQKLNDLGSVADINNHGQIIGNTMMNGGQSVIYKDGAITDRISIDGADPDSVAGLHINDKGQVTGTYMMMGEVTSARGFIYENGAVKDLGTLYGASGEIFTNDMNNSGEVVGGSFESGWVLAEGRGYLYSNGKMTDLNTLIDPTAGWRIWDANSINDNHQILANVCRTGDKFDCKIARLDLTSPVPEPEAYAMLLAGLGLLGWSARRKAKKAA
ncbi:MAG: PEP-CTERM sorting domain-containing protein [Pseudomonadota bacterium]